MKSSHHLFYYHVTADSGKLATNFYHKVNAATLALTPIAFILPESFTMPIDIALGILFPIHSHIGLNYVVTDYLPKVFPRSFFPIARAGLVGFTGLMLLGLLKLNITGNNFSQPH